MAPMLNFSLRDDDPWFVSTKAFDILAAYLQPQSLASAIETAARLDALTPSKRQLLNGEEAEESASFLLQFWEVVVVIAQQVPYNHPSQERLIELIRELKRVPEDSIERTESIWIHLERLDNVLYDKWKEPSELEGEVFKEWINLNSFTARLYGDYLINGSHFPIWTIRGSLEVSITSTIEILESRVSAAAQWIQHGSTRLVAKMRQAAPDEGERRAYESRLFRGGQVLSLNRWRFWKLKFEELAELEVSGLVKTEATRAARIMNNLV